ncbi:MRPL43 [Cordylochernes scorpioides]|uniref:Large ribosomal subunit protein mL43 n=1 Tax=Cordylochernes scorpioides TaxID=51811 RepID=A0ABY6LR60_9ARAC|nr:MRPL43 [Cordylochernes scorpioides]
MSNRSQASTFIKKAVQNGIGRHVCQLQRLTLKFCKSSGTSRYLREFMEKHLIDFAKENPGVVIYLKPRRHRKPVIEAQYLNGYTQSIYCDHISENDMLAYVNYMRTRSGSQISRLRKLNHTETPSIQGPWTPFTNKATLINIATFPNEELSKYTPMYISATEKLRNLTLNLSEADKEETDKNEEEKKTN